MKDDSTMQDPFSIIIPVYNKAAYLPRAVNSILSQTVQDFEILVIDDASTDHSVEIIRSIADPRIRLFQQETNRGVSAARNRGIQEAQYNWVAFLDADDEWKPDYLATIRYLQKKYPGCGAYATAYEYFYDGSMKVIYPAIRSVPNNWDGIITDYFKMAADVTPICTDAIVVSRNIILKMGGFLEGISHGEDLFMWAEIAINYPIAYKNSSHAIYHQNVPGQLTDSAADFDGEATKILLERYPEEKIPPDYRKSFKDYLSRRILLGSRKLILLEKKGKEARELLSLLTPSELPGAKRVQYIWNYFGTIFPDLFRLLVTIKDRIKSMFSKR